MNVSGRLLDYNVELRDPAILFAPTTTDALLCRRFLCDSGIPFAIYRSMTGFCAALCGPIGALVIPEETLRSEAGDCIQELLALQEDWSALPIICLCPASARNRLPDLGALASRSHITRLERPVQMGAFVGVLRLALQERAHQQRIRQLLAERAEQIRQRDDFLALLSHELRNPLAATMICVDLLKAVPPGTERDNHCRDVIGNQVRQMKRLLDDLLDVSRLTRHKLEIRREHQELGRVLAEAAQQVEGEIARRGQQLSIERPESPIPLYADALRLRQVFANLLNNAARYSPDGSRIEVAVETAPDFVTVRIKDQGQGMTAHTLARLFEPFYQASDETNGSTRGGLGVGLTLARSLVEMHAGAIEARSDGLGKGSEFIVRLPLCPRDVTPTQANGESPRALPRPRRILLIEDNRDFARGLRLLLEDRGHQVLLAADGPEGLRAARTHSPDVIVLDIGLPGGMNGYEVARCLRLLPGMERARLIAVSGYGRGEDRERSRSAGVDLHLTKPVHLDELEAAMA